jgi:D-erythronate 2-dehydrogenase
VSSDAVLVTGACGLVGAATVRQVIADGRRVVASDIDTAATRKIAAALPAEADMHYADLTDVDAVAGLVETVDPVAIIHLAAMIPPLIYTRREAAYKVNVGGTAALLAAAQRQAIPPRFVLASSVAVYGGRNPHRTNDLLTVATPVNPADIYGAQKVGAEKLVRAADLDSVILRLGGILTVEPNVQSGLDLIYLERLLPADGRVQTVDVRDVARAFIAATTADCVGETLLIGGDDTTHRHRQGDVGASMAAALGLVNGLPPGLNGDPNSDADWYNTDWMDTDRAQEILYFQHHSWIDMLAEVSQRAGWKRGLLRLVSPLVREALKRRSAYRGSGRRYADPWGAISAKWGDPAPTSQEGP